MKATLRILVVFFLILSVFIIFRNALVKKFLAYRVSQETGLPAQVDTVDWDLGKSFIRIKGLTLFNPEEFHQKTMFEIPEIHLHYRISNLFKGEAAAHSLVVRMKRLIVEKNDKGKLNIDFLKDMALVRRRECSDLDTRGSPHPSLSIKDFYFYIEKVIYVDYSKAGVPSAREFKVKFRKKFEDVDNHEGVSCFLLEKVLELARLDELTNLVDLKAKVKDVKRVIWSGLER